MKRKRFATGPPRPRYLSDRDVDRAVMMIFTLTAEVSALRARLDTHERLAQQGLPATPEAVESYDLPDGIGAARDRDSSALIARLTRPLLDEAGK